MYKFIKDNQKKMLAVFSVLLMVVFFIPQGAKQGQQRARRAIGKMGDTLLYADEKEEAAQEWAMLKGVPTEMPAVFLTEMLPPQYAQFVQPLQQEKVPITLKLGPLAQQIEEHPELFLLLSLQAERDGIVVSDDALRTFVTNDMKGEYTNPREVSAARRYLLVQALYDRVTSSVKVTQPIWQRTLADNYQKVQVAMAEFPVDKFRKTGPSPTTQQVEQQYDKFKNVDPNASQKPVDDPLGFGYQTPTRVKVQYIELPHKAVLDAVRRQKSAYEWEVDARRYYYSHESEFNRMPPRAKPATQPGGSGATRPSTAPAAVASTGPSPTTGPSTRPFAEVHQEIMDKVLEQPAKELEQKIKDAIAHRLDADYQSDQPASGTTRPADSGIASKAYLDQVALAIQKQFGVLPEVQQFGDPKNSLQLGVLPGIGESRTEQSKPFPQYATADDNAPAAFPGAPQPETSKPLALYQPSEPLHDSAGNLYIFRLTDYAPAHAADLQNISSQVAVDVATAGAYKDAMAAARKVLASARKDGLAKAAGAAGAAVTLTPFFRPGNAASIPDLKLLPDSAAELGRRAALVLAEASPDSNEHPVALVDLPSDRKVLVIELVGAEPVAPADNMYVFQLLKVAQDRHAMAYRLADEYFNYDTITTRLQFHPEATNDRTGT